MQRHLIRVEKVCLFCKKQFSVKGSRANSCKFCSLSCKINGKSAKETFWLRMKEDTSGCWIWTGALFDDGYGAVGNHLVPEKRAHRLDWHFAYGPIPEGLLVCHKCDTPACCRPEHLFIGTTKDNCVDCCIKGRKNPLRGEMSPSAKLTETDIRDIRSQYDISRHFRGAQARLAREYKVSYATIYGIVTRRRWAHIV